jgi:hypothetical protein
MQTAKQMEGFSTEGHWRHDPSFIRRCTIFYDCLEAENGRQKQVYIDFINYGTVMFYGKDGFKALEPLMRSLLPSSSTLLSFKFQEDGELLDPLLPIFNVPLNYRFFVGLMKASDELD